MQLVGPNLNDLHDLCGKRFSHKTTLHLAIQLLSILDSIHKKGVVLRNLAPKNMCMGLDGQKDTLFLVDFSESQYFIDFKT